MITGKHRKTPVNPLRILNMATTCAPFVDDVRDRIMAPLLAAVCAHPFNVELAAGTLDQAKFRFYLLQDAAYLVDYGRALALMGARCTTSDALMTFLDFARGAVVTERSLHETYFTLFGVSKEQASRIVQSPACQAYTSYLIATAATADLAEAMAAVLPCFWVYLLVGKHIAGIAKGMPSSSSSSPLSSTNEFVDTNGSKVNPFHLWIETYSGDAFEKVVNRAIQITSDLAAKASPELQARMRSAFERGCRFEYMFWDSAYKMEGGWPPVTVPHIDMH